jgi:hypothetical protein
VFAITTRVVNAAGTLRAMCAANISLKARPIQRGCTWLHIDDRDSGSYSGCTQK